MAVVFNHASSNGHNAATSASWSHTATGDNYLLVSICLRAAVTGLSVTYNGVSMTQIATKNNTYDYQYVYELVNPTTGSNTIAASWTGSTFGAHTAGSFSGYDHKGTITTGTGAATTDPVTATATLVANGILAGFYGIPDTVSTVAVSTGTERAEVNSTDNSTSGQSFATNTGTGSVNITWTHRAELSSWIAIPLNPPFLLTDNIIAYYKLDGNSNDATGNGHNGTDTSMTYSATNAVINTAGQFSGSGKILVADHADFDGTTAVTMAAWVKFSSLTSQQIIFSKSNAGGTAYMYLAKNAGNKITASVDTEAHSIVGGTTIGTSTKYFCVVTYDGATLKLYLNGASDATNVSYAGALTPGTGSVAIGELGDLNTQYTSGTIDEVGWWSRALSSTEITQLYNSGSGRQYPFPLTTTYNQTVAATGAGVAKALKAITASRTTLHATGTGIGKAIKAITAARTTLHAIGAGTGKLLKRMAKTLASTGAGTATMIAQRAFLVTLASTAVGIATLVKTPGKILKSTGVGVATVVKSTHKILSVIAIGVGTATLTKQMNRTLHAIGSATATLINGVMIPLHATASATATLIKTPGKALKAIGGGVATIAHARGVVMHATAIGHAVLVKTPKKMLSVIASAIARIRQDFWRTKYTSQSDDYGIKYPHGD